MIEEVLKSFVVLFIIMDPIAVLPIFLGLAKGLPQKVIKKQVNDIVIVGAFIMLAFIFLGNALLNFFSIDIISFQIAGGIILLIFGILIVAGIDIKHKKAEGNELAVPVGTPLLVGPGTITTIIILVGRDGISTTLIASIMALIAAFVILSSASKIYAILGRHWINVVSRVIGIIVAAIAVDFIREGIIGILRGI